MRGVRILIGRHGTFAALLVAAALLLRVAVPAGWMIDAGHGTVAVVPCSGSGPMAMAAMAMPGKAHHDGHRDGSATPCAFAGLSMQALGAIAPVLLAVAAAVIVALGLRPAPRPAPPRGFVLRPPPIGPPGPA